MFRSPLTGGLRSRLVLLVLLTLLPVLAAATLANVRQRNLALDGFLVAARRTTAGIAADLDRLVTNSRLLLTVLPDLPEVRAGGEACETLLRKLLTVHPQLTNLALVEVSGAVRCAAAPLDVDPLNAKWFDRAVAHRSFVVGDSLSQPESHQRALTLAYPVVRDGRVVEVVFAVFDLTMVNRLLSASSVAQGAVETVFDSDGLILFRSEGPEEWVGRPAPVDALQRIRDSGTGGSDTIGFDGVIRRYVTATWGTGGLASLTLAVGYPVAEMMRPYNQVLFRQSVFLVLGVLIGMLMVNRAARTLLIRPIQALVSATARVRQGDLTVRVPPGGGDELQELSEAFNLAVESLGRNRDLEEQLRHAQRLQAIGHLAGGVAHEFNNMLTVILGHTELLLDGEPHRKDYAAIHEAAERSRILTRELLAFSRRQLLQPKRAGLNELVRQALGTLGGLLGPRVQTTLALASHEIEVFVDRIQLEHVLLNVLLNARDAMPAGGALTLATSRVTVFNGQLEGLTDGDYAELTIADTGVGMSEDTLSRALEPFFTTKPFGQGTGLGLSTAYGIIRQSGGQLSLVSEAGRGTTVRIHLPLA